MSNNSAAAQAGPPQQPTPTPTPTSPTSPPTAVARQTPPTTQQPAPTTGTATPTYNTSGQPNTNSKQTAPETSQPSNDNADMAKALLLLTSILQKRPEEKDRLAAHLEEQAAEKDDPWKKKRAALRRRTKGWEEDFTRDEKEAWDELRHSYGKAGYNQLLSEETALELHYLLCATPLQAYRRARSLLQLNTDDRLAFHNFGVGQRNGETFMERWGPEINALPVPLFPATRDHEDTNQKLLAQMSNFTATVKGGGTMKKPKFYIFAKPQQATATAAGYKLPVENNAVDVGIVEEEFEVHNQRYAKALARIEALEAANRKNAKNTNYSNNQGYNNNNNQSYNNHGHNINRGNGGRGRGNNTARRDEFPNDNYYNSFQNNNTSDNNYQPHYHQNNNNYNNYNGNRGRGRGGQQIRGRGDFEEGNGQGDGEETP
jgi:hypothetical protein